MRKYNSLEIEIVEAPNIVTNSREVETEKIPLYSVDEIGSYQL